MDTISVFYDALLEHGSNPCYFGSCESEIPDEIDVSEFKNYIQDEIDYLYTRFMQRYSLTHVSLIWLELKTINHILYHFVLFLRFLKNKYFTSNNVCKMILFRKWKKKKPKGSNIIAEKNSFTFMFS